MIMMFFLFLLLMLDKCIIIRFFWNKVNVKVSLPNNLRKITGQQYQAIIKRIIEFKTNVLLDKSVDLLLTADEINILHYNLYNSYHVLIAKDPRFVFLCVEYYDIIDNELIKIQRFPLLFFKLQQLELKDKTAIKFTLSNGKVLEEEKKLVVFNQFFPYTNYEAVEKHPSQLIHFILNSSDETMTMDREQIRKSVDSTVQKLKAIKIQNNKLILSS